MGKRQADEIEKEPGDHPKGAKQRKNIHAVKQKTVLPCDNICPMYNSAGIFQDVKTGEPYACVLNQTNIAQNNNKFFVIQVLKKFDCDQYYTWIRWGRVGYEGQKNLVNCGNDVSKAIATFEKKFSDKTENYWDERKDFVKVPGKYDLVETELSNQQESEKSKDSSKDNDAADTIKELENAKKSKHGEKSQMFLDCKLALAVQELIELICDVNAMKLALADVEFDTDKTPLGKISTDQIKAGYAALNQISHILKANKSASISKRKQLTEISSQFYTRIPHCCGMRAPPVIDNEDLIGKKLKMLEVLGDIKLGMDLLKQSSNKDVTKSQNGDTIPIHPIDRLYQNLNCGISVLPHNTEEFILIEKYILSTHAATHSSYTMDVDRLYTLSKDDYMPGYKGELIGNRVLLFHGSRLSNWAGILSRGLRIAPPEAPATGYMFGKGVYFADMSSKSANYCFPTPSNPYGLLLLCEVALGSSSLLVDADYNAGTDLPKDFHSVKGVGRVAPSKENWTKLEDGTVVPMGPAKEKKNGKSLTLNYNEFIVYDTKQIRIRYLAKIKFNFKY